MIHSRQILAPATSTAVSESLPFDVDDRSTVVYIAPSSGETLTEDDSFELRRVVDPDGSRSVKINDAGTAVLLGANNPQFEVLIRGTYIIKKILTTTESVGVYELFGVEEIE